MAVEIGILGQSDLAQFERVAEGVFDHAVDPAPARQFLADPRHHLAVAIEEGVIVGFASGVHYVHPDKPPEMFINEVGVAPSHQRRGLGRAALAALLDRARAMGCVTAWVLTDPDNAPAHRLYGGLGGVRAPRPQVMFEFDLKGRA
ncbi:MAG TPA: GNAT family N-acetyltransferase [Caulobacteraceae bacterium]|nr:GNAT family N-acetyltransferase [Caulobacteraceae bacterium]